MSRLGRFAQKCLASFPRLASLLHSSVPLPGAVERRNSQGRSPSQSGMEGLSLAALPLLTACRKRTQFCRRVHGSACRSQDSRVVKARWSKVVKFVTGSCSGSCSKSRDERRTLTSGTRNANGQGTSQTSQVRQNACNGWGLIFHCGTEREYRLTGSARGDVCSVTVTVAFVVFMIWRATVAVSVPWRC